MLHPSFQDSILLGDDRLLRKLHAATRTHFVRLWVQAMPAAIGLLMPAAALLASIFLGDDRLLLATCAAPYLLTLLSQIWMEGHFVKQGACQLPAGLPLTRQSWLSPGLISSKQACGTSIYMHLPEQPICVQTRPADAMTNGSLQSCASSLKLWHTNSSGCCAAAY